MLLIPGYAVPRLETNICCKIIELLSIVYAINDNKQ